MPFFSKDSTKIYFDSAGDSGPWITLINGHTRASSDFKLFAKNLANDGYRALVFDNRGSGQTICEPGFTINDMAADIVDLWRFVGIERSSVVGISMGGMIAQHLCGLQTDVVKNLVLVSTAASSKWIESEVPWGDTKESVSAKLGRYFTETFLAGNKILVDAMVNQIHKSIVAGDFTERAALQRRAIADFDGVSLSPSISVPTLVIHGQEDKVIDVEAGRELARLITGSTLEVFEGAGHLLLAERNREFYARMTTFLGHADE